jgi:hypothetical protein
MESVANQKETCRQAFRKQAFQNCPCTVHPFPHSHDIDLSFKRDAFKSPFEVNDK